MGHARAYVLGLVGGVVGLALVVPGCGGGGGGGGGGAATAPFGLTQRAPVTGLNVGTGATGSPLAAARAFPALSFPAAIQVLAYGDGSDRLVVVQQTGQVSLFDASSNATSSSTPLLDVSTLLGSSSGEEGLLGLAFDPAFATNGFLYVHYSAGSPRRSVFARFTVTGTPPSAPLASQLVLLEVAQPFSNHNGGMLAFGTDGMLYASLGDGGSGGDPMNHGQDLATLLGSILRLDVRSASAATPYVVPPDNPFVGTAGAAPEIWCYGLRNPWRFSFDRQTGDLWVGDVGQGAREEVSIATRGSNLGWRVYEGNLEFNNPTGLPASAFIRPIVDHDRNDGASVIGGYVYRGTAIPSLVGRYLYGDFVSGNLWTIVPAQGAASRTLAATIPSLTSFGEDRAGELYATSHDGQLWRFSAGSGGGGTTPPALLSQTGLFADLATLAPAPGIVEYDVVVPFFSDGARKRRFLALPGTSTIGFDATGPWTFPVGTALVKHFELETTPGTFRRLETRLLVRQAGGWTGFTYRWNTAGSDADLLAAGEDLALSTSGGPRTYHVPGPAECATCHNQAAGHILGANTQQLRRTFAYPAATDDQLRAWNNIGLFDRDIGSEAQYTAHPRLDDVAVSLDARARTYLEVNCSSCHRPGGPSPAGIDLRAVTPLAQTALLDVAPGNGDLGLTNARRIAPGDRTRSVLWERLRRTDASRMPPIGRDIADPQGVDLIGAWIDGL
jgi:uncharacterized repeat protein (TIGR03806 family)